MAVTSDDQKKLCYAGPGDVACDMCSGRKVSAVKSCLQCLGSYCKEHLKPHYNVAALKRHKLVDTTNNLQDNICGHETVKMLKEVEDFKLKILQRITDKEEDVKALEQELNNICCSANTAVEHSKRNFEELIRLIKERAAEVKQQIRSQQETEERRVKDLQGKLQKEIIQLKTNYTELDKLSQNQLLHNFQFLGISKSFASSRIVTYSLCYFKDLTAAVSSLSEKLQYALNQAWTNISQTVPEVLLSKPQPLPKTRPEFLQYSRQIMLDLDTAHTMLLPFDGDTKVMFMSQHQSYPEHPDRFTHWPQVLSRQSVTGRCYWEVEWTGAGVYIAVAYKSVRRQGNSYECLFGSNMKSWALCCTRHNYSFMYNGVKAKVKGPRSNRVGVYLDHAGGVLVFYSLTDKMTLLRKVLAQFTEPLHVGLRLWATENTAAFSKLTF